jgi:predicted nucleotidyltransferase
MNKIEIIDYLHKIKPRYAKEGLSLFALFGSITEERFNDQSDIDILYETDARFTNAYPGFAAFARLKTIADELSIATGRKIDLVPKAYLGPVGKKYILNGKLLYV